MRYGRSTSSKRELQPGCDGVESALDPTLSDHQLSIYASNDSKGDVNIQVVYETDDLAARQDGRYVAGFMMLITRKEYSIRASIENRLIDLIRFVVCDGLNYSELFEPIVEKLKALCQPTEITIDDRLGWEHDQVFAE